MLNWIFNFLQGNVYEFDNIVINYFLIKYNTKRDTVYIFSILKLRHNGDARIV